MESSKSENNKKVIEHKAYARVGLLGNPSDVYYGHTISFTFDDFWADVQLQPSDHLIITPHPTHDLVQFQSFPHLVSLSLSLSLSLIIDLQCSALNLKIWVNIYMFFDLQCITSSTFVFVYFGVIYISLNGFFFFFGIRV